MATYLLRVPLVSPWNLLLFWGGTRRFDSSKPHPTGKGGLLVERPGWRNVADTMVVERVSESVSLGDVVPPSCTFL